MSESAEWLAEHQGRYVKTIGFIWECGDDCRCEEAQVQDIFENKTDRRFIVRRHVWSGTFTTEDARIGGDAPSPEAELAEYRRALRLVDPEREAAIEWQQGIDYDTSRPGNERRTT
jgi:hypothetical protein